MLHAVASRSISRRCEGFFGGRCRAPPSRSRNGRKDLHENNQRQLQIKAFLRFASAVSSDRGQSVRGRDKSDAGFRPAQQRQFAKQRQDQNRPYWYGKSALLPITPSSLQKEGAQKLHARPKVLYCPSRQISPRRFGT